MNRTARLLQRSEIWRVCRMESTFGNGPESIPAKFPDTNLGIKLSSLQVDLKDFNLVSSRKLSSRVIAERSAAVVLPLLNVVAYGDRVPPKPHVPLSEAEVEDVLMAPLRWCPHPGSMISMRVAGDSMAPIIPPDAIIAVDTAVTELDALDQGSLYFLIAISVSRWLGCRDYLPRTFLCQQTTNTCPWT
jgi:hypothetical protein